MLADSFPLYRIAEAYRGSTRFVSVWLRTTPSQAWLCATATGAWSGLQAIEAGLDFGSLRNAKRFIAFLKEGGSLEQWVAGAQGLPAPSLQAAG